VVDLYEKLPLEWSPGQGGLLALVPLDALPTVVELDLAPSACAVRPLHMTLLRGVAMAPLVSALGPDWEAVRATLPPIPWPQLMGLMRLAVREPHPTKDPPGEKRPRRTWFLEAGNQGELRDALSSLVVALDGACVARGGPSVAPALSRAATSRFFHVSLYNDREGDPMRSIGDIGPLDC
jgi:hypothetical protein